MNKPTKVISKPIVTVHLRPILSAIKPAIAKPATDATPPTIISVLV